MTEFRKGDVCSLEVVVENEKPSGYFGVSFRDTLGIERTLVAPPSHLTLIRRASVDLATCDLPVAVRDAEGRTWELRARDDTWGGVVSECGDRAWLRLDTLRPADAPAPAAEAGEVERLRATLEIVSTYEASNDNATLRMIREAAKLALASTAPSCPPGHVLINGHVVPEPMREAPEDGEIYYAPAILGSRAPAISYTWNDDGTDRAILDRGLCHATKEAAEAHFNALIAPTKREDV